MRRDRAHVRAGDETEALRKAAERLEVDPENIELREAREGTYLVIVTRADARLSVRISDDALAATVTELSEPIGDGRPLSEETVREQLQAAGVQVEPDPEALADLLQRAQKGEDVGGIVLATGTPPRDGADGCFESALALDSSVGAEKADGSVDFYERNVAPSVGEGDAIGRITPPEEGTPGRDVRGNVLPAGDGAPAPVRPGANVIVSEDGLELHAEIGGVVVLDGETLSVTQTFQIPGDVDFSTGNVRMEGGSLEVGGTVRSGFTVTCKGDLEVGGAIEEATIEVGGDVSVGGGIVMGEEGRLRAGGDVSARFAENAHIEAGGDVVIDNDVSNCHVVAAGRLVATGGKGRIQGGDI
ncbi:MAG: FapA family protein, partial [Candidatus Brocadiia bacterium]